MTAINDLDALAERHPEHALLVRTIKAQITCLSRSPDSPSLRAVLAANVERLGAAVAGGGR